MSFAPAAARRRNDAVATVKPLLELWCRVKEKTELLCEARA
jgi:hypothetical protein